MLSVHIGIKTSPQEVGWATLDATWARIGEHDIFQSVWLNDHLTDPRLAHGGQSFEGLMTLGLLLHRVPGRWVGHAVLSNTFRHPAVLAKQATLLDHATGGRFILGLGAGWHEGEHAPYGISLPPVRERFDRFESAVHVLKALFSDEAGTEPGVTRDDPWYPLREATNEPSPATAGGPPLWLGGQKRRGVALAARLAQGWVTPAILPDEDMDPVDYFRDRREALLGAMDEIERDPADFAFGAQIYAGFTGADRRAAMDQALAVARLGATHVLLGMPARLGPAGVDAVAHEVAEPLRQTLG